MVWIVEWTQPSQNGIAITVWNSRDEAHAAASADIMCNISSDWDLTDADYKAAALTISNDCGSMKFQEAMDAYNEWEGDGDYEVAQFYRVYEKPIQKTVPPIHLLGPLPNTNNVSTIPAPPAPKRSRPRLQALPAEGRAVPITNTHMRISLTERTVAFSVSTCRKSLVARTRKGVRQ